MPVTVCVMTRLSHAKDLFRPPLKWAGGKYTLLRHLQPLLADHDHLVEPFVGAGAVFLNTHHKALLNDINPDLMGFYRYLQTHPEHFIQQARKLFVPITNDKQAYLEIRQGFNASTCWKTRAILFLYLNRHGYNGLCRYNSQGLYNVPFGKHPKILFPEQALLQCAKRLQHCQLQQGSFEAVFANLPARSIIYCDPPYAPLSPTASFTKYSATHFAKEAQPRLAELAEQAQAQGHTVIISNHATAWTRELYKNADHWIELPVRRSISCHKEKRAPAQEIIALYRGFEN